MMNKRLDRSGSLTSSTRTILLLLTLRLLNPGAASGQVPGGTVTGFSSEGLARVDSAIGRYIADEKVAGAVVLVLRDGRIAFQRAVGWADRDSGKRMTADAIFRIASQTKALTSVAVMMLAEEGKLSIDDEVGEYLPAFEHTTVAVRTDTGLAVVEAENGITIRHLLTHTAGISYGTDTLLGPLYRAQGLGPAAGFGWYLADKDEPACETIERLARLPFAAQPGEQFVYGYSVDVLGCIVERVSGMSLDEFFLKRITGPLRMQDTHFFLPSKKASRLATVYTAGEDGKVRRAPDGARGQGNYIDGPRRSFSGGAGLVSTARDYARFLQMILNEGELDGVRILPDRAVEQMTQNQVGELFGKDSLGFGLGFETAERDGAWGAFPRGAFRWGGAYGSRYVVVPDDRLVIVVMCQLVPNSSDFRDAIPELIYRALLPSGE